MSEPMTKSLQGDRSRRHVAVAFMTHVLNRPVLDRFEKLDREAPSGMDVYLLLDSTNKHERQLQHAQNIAQGQVVSFDRTEVLDVEFPHPWADPTQRTLLPGNLDLLYLYFASLYPTYSRYWFIEYDVVYTGSWAEVFHTFQDSDADLLGTTLQSHTVRPHWYWWSTFLPEPTIDISEQLCGFFPIIRLSNELLSRLRAGYRAGWSGHSEAVVPTLARYHGLPIEDLGGDGPYVRESNTNQFYTNTPHSERLSPGTFVYRPTRSQPGSIPGILWHPVKPSGPD